MADSPIPPIFHYPLSFFGGLTGACYVLSVITGNVSVVDRIWSFAPFLYTAYFALLPLWPTAPSSALALYPYTPDTVHKYVTASYSPRALLMFALQAMWSIRLTYNGWRRGFFDLKNLMHEDYRWDIVRRGTKTWLGGSFFQIFNFIFIAFIQNAILFVISLPTAVAVAQPHTPLSISDYILAATAVGTLIAEFTADNQQLAYQTFKHTGKRDPSVEWPGARIEWTEEDKRRGFITRGLWAESRHPNFLREQFFWFVQNLIPLVAPPSPSLPLHWKDAALLWPLTPTLVICVLFYASTVFSERITAAKYPAYAAYQERVSMFTPLLTPVWGMLAQLRGRKERLDRVVFGQKAGDVDEGKKAL